MKASQQRFSGKVVIVTGGGSGIGKAIAKLFLAEGANVITMGRRGDVLKKTAEELNAGRGRTSYFVADVTKEEDCENVVTEVLAKSGKIDVLVNNAGIDDGNTKFLDTSLDLWDRVMSTNLRGTFVMSQLVAREMVKSGSGVILHNASIDGLAAEPGYIAYSCSKAGLVSLARSMAVELAQHGIRVNCVSPGYTHTELSEKAMGPELMRYLDTSFERVPLGRMAQPQEIAAVFAFLASEDAKFITGQNIVVDGGLTSNLYILETLKQRT